MNKMLELAERCEQAVGRGAEFPKKLFVEAHDLIWPVPTTGPRGFFTLLDSGGFIDAAMTLVPEGCSATIWTAGPRGFTTGPAARLFSYPRDSEAEGGYAIRALSDHEITAATPALALCSAALRACAAANG
jgi:hypothetical protein